MRTADEGGFELLLRAVDTRTKASAERATVRGTVPVVNQDSVSRLVPPHGRRRHRQTVSLQGRRSQSGKWLLWHLGTHNRFICVKERLENTNGQLLGRNVPQQRIRHLWQREDTNSA